MGTIGWSVKSICLSLSFLRIKPHHHMQMVGHHRETSHFDSETTGKQTNAFLDPRLPVLKAIPAQKRPPHAPGHAMHPARTGQIEEITASGGHGGSMGTIGWSVKSICLSLSFLRIKPHHHMQMVGHHRETSHFDSETTGKQTNAFLDPRLPVLKAIPAQKRPPHAPGHAMHPARTGQIEEITASGGHGGSMGTIGWSVKSICLSLSFLGRVSVDALLAPDENPLQPVRIEDRELSERLQLLGTLEPTERTAVIQVIDSMLTKQRMRRVLENTAQPAAPIPPLAKAG
ncbi:hypothetical protein LBMAG53_38310 [Planctomycetota bacterium]|nr:hypothetical protein LBMAG53_38310 [Planctomycetota bacterium]